MGYVTWRCSKKNSMHVSTVCRGKRPGVCLELGDNGELLKSNGLELGGCECVVGDTMGAACCWMSRISEMTFAREPFGPFF